MLETPVRFTNARGDTLSGVIHYPATQSVNKGAILCHGMESNKESEKIFALSKALAEKGILALRFDFSYVGDSSGKFEEITYSGEVEDLEAACKFMLKLGVQKIGICGSSMGGTVALLFAAQNADVATVVTIAAPVHPERFASRLLTPEQVQRWRNTGYTFYHGQRINVSLLHDLEKINVPEAAKKITCPVLVLHGDMDDVVPVEEAHELHGCIPGAKKLSILKGADHRLSDPTLMTRAVSEAIEWLCEHIC